MRLYAPLHEDESALRPDAAMGEAEIDFFGATDFATGRFRSDWKSVAAVDRVLEVQAILQRAQRARNAYIAGKLTEARLAIQDWLERKAN
jgi:hypothetical protein